LNPGAVLRVSERHTEGTAVITDFNTTAQDHIAVSVSGFGDGLTAGLDVTPIFETSGDN
jgi:hypothetical protein